MNKVKRYLLLAVGLFFNSLGVSFVTKAGLGTSPISSIPYVLSLNSTLTLGETTVLFSILLILLQLIMLRRHFRIRDLLQLPVSLLFGGFIDLTMKLLFFVTPDRYPENLFYLAVGSAVLGFGVWLEVVANVVMLPGEAFVRAVCLVRKSDFGKTKVAFDVSITIAAALLSLLFSRRVEGVREGTVIAALLVGMIARRIARISLFVSDFFRRRHETALENREAK